MAPMPYLACCGCSGQSQVASSQDAELTEQKAIQSPCFAGPDLEQPVKEPLLLSMNEKQQPVESLEPAPQEETKEEMPSNAQPEEERGDLEGVHLEIASEPLKVLFHCPGTEETLARFHARPLGIVFEPESNPLTIRDVDGQATALGINPGWTVKGMYNASSGRSPANLAPEQLMRDLKAASMSLPFRVNKCLELIFEAAAGERRAVGFVSRPLGLTISKVLPITVTAVKDHAAELGVQPGWRLLAIAGEALGKGADSKAVAAQLASEAQELPVVERSNTLPVVFRDHDGFEHPILFEDRPLGLTFSWSGLPLAISGVSEKGRALGVKEGWQVVRINGQSAEWGDYNEVMKRMQRAVERLPTQQRPKLDLVLVPDVVCKVVQFSRRPFGINFTPSGKLTVDTVTGHAAEQGVKPGWVVRGFGDREDVSTLSRPTAMQLWRDAEAAQPAGEGGGWS